MLILTLIESDCSVRLIGGRIGETPTQQSQHAMFTKLLTLHKISPFFQKWLCCGILRNHFEVYWVSPIWSCHLSHFSLLEFPSSGKIRDCQGSVPSLSLVAVFWQQSIVQGCSWYNELKIPLVDALCQLLGGGCLD